MGSPHKHAELIKAWADAGLTAIANASLRHAIDTDQVVPMEKVREVARELAAELRAARDLAIAGAVQRACEDQASGSLPFLPVFALDLLAISLRATGEIPERGYWWIVALLVGLAALALVLSGCQQETVRARLSDAEPLPVFVHLDTATGCEYVAATPDGALTPRLGADHLPICHPPEKGTNR